jgi:hypothetical protein
MRTKGVDFEYLDGLRREIYGAGRGSKVKDEIDRAIHVKVVGHVVIYVAKAGIFQMVRDIVHAAGNEVVEGDDFAALRQQAVAKVGPKETGAAGDYRARH